MKKSYLALGAIAIALSSCSNDADLNPGQNPQIPGTEGYEPISLALSSATADVEQGARTRGGGTVGGVVTGTGATDWKGENLYILMTSSDASCLEKTTENTTDGWGFTSAMGQGPVLKEQFCGGFFARATAVSEDTKWTINYKDYDTNEQYDDGAIDRFYPQQGESQFFAYFVDDAFTQTSAEPFYYSWTDNTCTAKTGVTTPTAYPKLVKGDFGDGTNNAYYVDYTIDGTQDLLTGAAAGSFSAKTSRAGNVPNIVMNHMLSRLTFVGVVGSESSKKVTLNSITVKDVQTTGKMLVAYKSDVTPTLTQKMVWVEGTVDDFVLMQSAGADPNVAAGTVADGKTDLTALVPIHIGSITDVAVNKTFKIGEAMFVAPKTDGADHVVYEFEVGLTYELRGADEPGGQVVENAVLPLKLKIAGGLEQGKSYRVILTIYGLESIKVTAQLVPWESGDDIYVGGDGENEHPLNGGVEVNFDEDGNVAAPAGPARKN